ncbi:MAG: A/G-specific adenine glycosylase [Bdellovibrionales bacterium]|nr:A/G-specific adenine glycosylase [Bdellovibrionales bacterium]
MAIQKKQQTNLLNWFKINKRELPWRKTQDPYKIWISEVMLQQTTVKAVIPYYEKFLKKFPNVKSLAKTNRQKIYSLWAGLGYYSRAENLMKAAQIIEKKGGFPENFKELLKLPGFGPYTARAVSSLAFEESVGVLDGNVIRFLARFHGLSIKWWTTKGRSELQHLADLWIKNQLPSQMNQALMEQGALICSPKPLCFLCAVNKKCEAFQQNTQEQLPLKKKKKQENLLHWQPQIIKRASDYAFVKNTTLPFLKKHPVFPGTMRVIKRKPQSWDFRHSIMHYKIYVTIQRKRLKDSSKFIWIPEGVISQSNPSSLIQKVLKYAPNSRS